MRYLAGTTRILLPILLITSASHRVISQIVADNLPSVDSSKSNVNIKKKFYPNPGIATKFALLPGAGQIYNRDYWKVPIVYLCLGGGFYAYYLNAIKYNDFLDAYESFYDSNGVPSQERRIVRVRNLFNTSSTLDSASRDQIERQKNYWRRNKNLSVIVTGVIYALSIIEANVAAHLKTFDLSDDLSFRVEPKFSQPLMKNPAPGIRIVFCFK